MTPSQIHPESPAAGHDCCAVSAKAQMVNACAAKHGKSSAAGQPAAAHPAHHVHAGASSSHARLTTAATLHCLTGCAIGEWMGLAIGVSLGLYPWATMALATVLGFASGYTLGLWPLVRQGMGWGQAFKTIWLGETISIAAMEFAMNFTDYHVGGVQAASPFAPQFWLGFAAALTAGFGAAWPVNWWLLRSRVKKPCH